MNRKFFQSFAVIFIVFLFPICSHSAGWYNNFIIQELRFSHGSGNVRLTIRVVDGVGDNNPDNCDVGGLFIIPNTAEREAQETAMLSGILTAFSTGKRANAYIMGCVSGIGGSSFPKIHSIYVQK